MNTIQNVSKRSANEEQAFKYQCMVRQLLKWRNEWGLRKYQAFINKDNWTKIREQTREDFTDQWIKGNRGEDGKWL